MKKDKIEKIDKAAAELRVFHSSKDIEKIKEKSEALTKILQEVATVAYQQAAAVQQAAQQAQGQQGQQTQQNAEDPKENVVDAEYEEVKDKKE